MMTLPSAFSSRHCVGRTDTVTGHYAYRRKGRLDWLTNTLEEGDLLVTAA